MVKAIKEAVKEYLEIGSDFRSNSRLIVCFTNNIYFEKNGSKNELMVLLTEFQINLIVIGYNLDPLSIYEINELCNHTEEGKLLQDPSLRQIEELFVSL